MRALALLLLSCASRRYGFPSRECSIPTVPTFHSVSQRQPDTRAVKLPSASAAVQLGSSFTFLQHGAGPPWPPWPHHANSWRPQSASLDAPSSPTTISFNVVATLHSSLANGVAAYHDHQHAAWHSWPTRHVRSSLHHIIRSVVHRFQVAGNPGHAFNLHTGKHVATSSHHSNQPPSAMRPALPGPCFDNDQEASDPFGGATIIHIYHDFICELFLFYVFDGEHEHHGRGFGCGTPRCNLIAIACVVWFFSPWGSGFPHLASCLFNALSKVTAIEHLGRILNDVTAFAAYIVIYISLRLFRCVHHATAYLVVVAWTPRQTFIIWCARATFACTDATQLVIVASTAIISGCLARLHHGCIYLADIADMVL